MLEAFIDESGTHGQSGVVCAAGYLFSPKSAYAFERDWIRFLSSKGLSRVHASEDHLRYDWPEISNVLLATIKRTAKCGFVHFAERTVFIEGKVRDLIGSSYTACVRVCMQKMARIANETGEQINYFIEQGNEYQGELDHFLNQIRSSEEFRSRYAMLDACFKTKAEAVQLHASDFLSWEFSRSHRVGVAGSADEPRRMIDRLRGLPHYMSGFSEGSVTAEALVHFVYGLRSNRAQSTSG